MNQESPRPAKILMQVRPTRYPVADLSELPDISFYAVHRESGERRQIDLKAQYSPDVAGKTLDETKAAMPEVLQWVMNKPEIIQHLGEHTVSLNQDDAFRVIAELLTRPHARSRWHGLSSGLPMLFLWMPSQVMAVIDYKQRPMQDDEAMQQGRVQIFGDDLYFTVAHPSVEINDQTKVPHEVIKRAMIEQMQRDYPFVSKYSPGWESTIVFE